MTSLPARLILPLLLLFGSFCSTLTRGGEDAEALKLQKDQREFDLFKLALQWPGTECKGTSKCCSTNGCCRPNAIIGFTIHGLWADYEDGTWPSCCEGSQFDENVISPLLDVLNKYWPSYRCGSSKTCHKTKGLFWAHEWEKHGTCSYPIIKNEYEYFVNALDLYFKYNVTEVLIGAGYVPSNSEKYPLEGIISAIQNAFHMTPEVTCSSGSLEELRLCFDKNFEPRDCETESNTESGINSLKSSSCPSNVSLPIYDKSQCKSSFLCIYEFLGTSGGDKMMRFMLSI
ncbi:PREDICTED: ribonuclease 2-like isoform X1 [Ipomoea nil]|uniref:ribonuclease 2-like isoform X1 n=1 Tax=Ipomoea nil TaxID=35883 RepID=UPI00090105A1|nr:PREDICTED: ribonuclease 2-like isoform X1 [Ipomoea nil]